MQIYCHVKPRFENEKDNFPLSLSYGRNDISYRYIFKIGHIADKEVRICMMKY